MYKSFFGLNSNPFNLSPDPSFLYRSNQHEEALASYRRAVQLAPDYAEAHNDLAVVLLDLGQTREAVACYREALRLKPDAVNAFQGRAVARSKLGDTRGAEADRQQAKEISR